MMDIHLNLCFIEIYVTIFFSSNDSDVIRKTNSFSCQRNHKNLFKIPLLYDRIIYLANLLQKIPVYKLMLLRLVTATVFHRTPYLGFSNIGFAFHYRDEPYTFSWHLLISLLFCDILEVKNKICIIIVSHKKNCRNWVYFYTAGNALSCLLIRIFFFLSCGFARLLTFQPASPFLPSNYHLFLPFLVHKSNKTHKPFTIPYVIDCWNPNINYPTI